jgi:hypothetical protein
MLAYKFRLNRLKFNSLLEVLKAVDFLFLFILEIVSLIILESSSYLCLFLFVSFLILFLSYLFLFLFVSFLIFSCLSFFFSYFFLFLFVSFLIFVLK